MKAAASVGRIQMLQTEPTGNLLVKLIHNKDYVN